MNDTMNEITAFSPFGGRLVLEEVKGAQERANVPENSIETKAGDDRSMYVYVPASGCPDAKQTQVVMFLRDGADEASAQAAMKEYGLDALAEKEHFVLAFPNPRQSGWSERDAEDMDYLSRCFMALPQGKGKVGGFIGMIFYIGGSPSAGALLLAMSARRPLNVAGVLLSELPADYSIPQDGMNAPQVAYLCGGAARAADYFGKVNGVTGADARPLEHAVLYTSPVNPNVRHIVSELPFSAQEAVRAWDMLFCKARRWSNDTYGTYQKRTDFTARGFVAHVNNPGLGVNEGFAHTWYEYVPPRLRGSKEKAPLVFYFHGIGCVPLYGAEQSGWHDIADRENFIVVYPKPARNKAWNIWDEPGMPSDQAFVLALLEHMKRTYAIDESRVYISGFSMGGMMTNALACAYPELFAAAAPCNGFNSGYLVPASEMWTMLRKMPTGRGLPDGPSEPVTRTRVRADAKKAAFAYRMPLIQNSGLLDGTWPAAQDDPFKRLASFDYWKTYNNIPLTPYEPAAACESGLTADETFYDCADGRFLHHRWFSRDEGKPALFEVVLAKRMPHALDLRQLELAWQFMKRFSRGKDGSLHIDP